MTTDGLLIGRGPGNHRLIVWCKACRQQRELFGANIVAIGDLEWRCTNCGPHMTDGVVFGSHIGPKR